MATIIGCGAQGRVQLEALRHGLDIRRVFAVDNDPAAAKKFTAEVAALGIDAEVPATLRDATLQSDVIVTCTTAHTPYLAIAYVPPGTFIAASARTIRKRVEIEPALMAHARVVTNVRAQCAVMGDLHQRAP